MDVRPVDPREHHVTEITDPVYRVTFWRRQSAHPDSGYSARDFELTGTGDVSEVFAWARTTAAPNETFVIHVRVDDCLTRLEGRDPTRNDPN